MPMTHWSAFPRAYFSGLYMSDVFECMGGFQMAVVGLDKHPPGWKSPHDW